jgi:hypothetical protein
VRHLSRYMHAHPNDHFFIISFVLPTTIPITTVSLFRRVLPRGDDEAFDRLADKFFGNLEVEKDRLKFFPIIEKAPWILKSAVASLGGERPVLVCKKIECYAYTGANYGEVSVDISTSAVAMRIQGLITSQMAEMCITQAFCIEAREDRELPERILAVTTGVHVGILPTDGSVIVLGDDGHIAKEAVRRKSMKP